MRVITISGHAQNGKDTFAKMVSEKLGKKGYRVLVTHYADLVKYICKMFFDWDGQKDDHGRELLQFVGTDIVRNENPDYWVNFIIDMLSFFSNCWDFVLIPDARFPNEIDRLRQEGFDVHHVRVYREGNSFKSPLTEEQQKHPSETSLDDCSPDMFIVNKGTLKDLESLADMYVDYLTK